MVMQHVMQQDHSVVAVHPMGRFAGGLIEVRLHQLIGDSDRYCGSTSGQ